MAGGSLDRRDPRQAPAEKPPQAGDFDSIKTRRSRSVEERPEFFRNLRFATREDLGQEFTQNLPLGIRGEKMARLVSNRPVPPFTDRLHPA